MTPKRIAELRLLAEKATPGPWTAGEVKGATQKVIGPPVKGYFPNHIIRDLALVYAPVENQKDGTCGPNSAFIVAARMALPEALDAIERMRALADLDDDLVKNAQRAFDNEPAGFEGDGYEPMRAALNTLVEVILAALEGKKP